MKLFLDTANIAEIKKYSFLIDGVTTNPTHLAKLGKDPKAAVIEIASLMKNKDVSVEITEKKPADVYKQAREIAKLADNIVVKVPCHQDYYEVIEKLVNDGIKLNITLVFTLIQSLYMAKLGVKYISPFIGRWDDIDVNGASLLFEIRQMMDQYNYSTEILAASLRNVRHMHEAILAGADVATLPASLLEKSMTHILTDQGMEKFDADWQKIGVKVFP